MFIHIAVLYAGALITITQHVPEEAIAQKFHFALPTPVSSALFRSDVWGHLMCGNSRLMMSFGVLLFHLPRNNSR